MLRQRSSFKGIWPKKNENHSGYEFIWSKNHQTQISNRSLIYLLVFVLALLPNPAASRKNNEPSRKKPPGKYTGAALLVKNENMAVATAGPMIAERPVTPVKAPCRYPCSDSSIWCEAMACRAGVAQPQLMMWGTMP